MNALVFSALMSLSSQTAASSLPVCDDSDVTCLKKHLVDQLLELQDLSQQLAATKGQLDIAKMAAQGAIDSARVANSYVAKIEADTTPHWYQSNVLWYALGFISASVVGISLAFAYAHVAR